MNDAMYFARVSNKQSGKGKTHELDDDATQTWTSYADLSILADRMVEVVMSLIPLLHFQR